jgi:hypothetical protein
LAGLTKRKAAVIRFRYMAILGSLILALVGLKSGCEAIIDTTINFIQKPFSIQAITAKLGEVLDH